MRSIVFAVICILLIAQPAIAQDASGGKGQSPDSQSQIEAMQQQLDELRVKTPQQKYEEYLRYREQFNGRGEPVSTSNPDSKRDWYVIGGRWDGWINDLDTSRESLADNTALTEEAIAREKIPHAIITPDGEWHERGQMGWWAMLLTENENWEQEARALLASYRGHRVVIVDAHI